MRAARRSVRPAWRRHWQCSAVRRSCQTDGGADRQATGPLPEDRGFPLVGDAHGGHVAPMPALANASTATAAWLCQMSRASCSTQPGRGSVAGNSRWATARMRLSRSKTMARELVVPWSRARMQRGWHGGLPGWRSSVQSLVTVAGQGGEAAGEFEGRRGRSADRRRRARSVRPVRRGCRDRGRGRRAAGRPRRQRGRWRGWAGAGVAQFFQDVGGGFDQLGALLNQFVAARKPANGSTREWRRPRGPVRRPGGR